MPTTTFFNLPAEKREKFLRAAREEFARVPFADASINRVIRAAGIPRGSFYMYFKDKWELLHFLLGEYGGRLAELLEAALREQNGDLLAAFLAFYDRVRLACRDVSREDAFRPLVAILRLNDGIHSRLFQAAGPGALLERLIPHIDRSRLFLRSDADLRDMLAIVMGITGPALFSALQTSDPDAARARYANFLDILARGMSAPAQSH